MCNIERQSATETEWQALPIFTRAQLRVASTIYTLMCWSFHLRFFKYTRACSITYLPIRHAGGIVALHGGQHPSCKQIKGVGFDFGVVCCSPAVQTALQMQAQYFIKCLFSVSNFAVQTALQLQAQSYIKCLFSVSNLHCWQQSSCKQTKPH